MFRFVLLVSCLALVSAQNYNKNPQHAAILSEQRYLAGDGKFGAAYTQEDGTDFKEETDSDGTRHGSYSYIDPNGTKRTVSYTAGKNGFQATGDHLPVAPPAPPQPIPQPQYQPQPQYNSPQQPQQHYNAQPAARGSNDYDDGSYDTRYNDPSFEQNGQQSSYRAPAPAPAPVHAPAPQQPQYNYNNQQQQQNYNQQPQYNHQQYQTTPQPQRNFQPPGKLQLNRTPDGFSYSFNKV
jgi:hypothetical protein